MGVMFLCDTVEYTCAYSSWNKIRMGLLHASMDFLQGLILVPGHNDDAILAKNMQLLLNEREKMTDVDQFNRIVHEYNHNMIDLLIRMELGGLYALMHKQDDTGYYSPGNALDILILLKKVGARIPDKGVRERIPSIKKLLKHSVATRKPILIF